MARKKFAAVVFSLGCVHASSLMALGLGELSLESFLNEPLKASVDLLNTGGLHQDEIKIRLATKEDFEKEGLDRAYFLTGIKFEVDVDEGGGARILMTSEDPVLEPYLDFIIEARWPTGRLLREYTVLIDPPAFDQGATIISASKRVEEVEGIPAPGKKKEPVDSTGTKVTVRKSDLGPGEMPQRDYNAETSPTPVAGSNYMIRRDDTLWEIAQQARPEGASVHQTMLDIQRLNPEAFINGNINQVKAGYIIYLPQSNDISSGDLAAALAEVKQQNEVWREGRASQPVARGPSLRISAEPEPTAGADTGTAAASGAAAAAMEDLEKAELDRAEMAQRLQAMQEQVETLQRIVSVKDEQIAALQQELAGVAAAAPVSGDEVPQELVSEPVDEGEIAAEETTTEAVAVAEAEEEPVAEEAVVEPAKAPPAKPVPVAPVEKPAVREDSGMMSTLLYGLGAIVLAVLAFVMVRRRRAPEEEQVPAAREDAFAEVELQDQQLEVEAPAEVESVEEVLTEEPVVEPGEDEGDKSRGYGERKHDEYASDVDEVDALAEADIYIAYGRYPQAIDLLKNAIGNEPKNPSYRLKLLELHTEMGDKAAAQEQYAELQAIGDAASLERAEALMASVGGADAAPSQAEPVPEVSPLDLLPEGDEPLEATFSDLEIEQGEAVGEEVAEELDLTADFADSELDQDVLDEDLVVAAESNGFSTKLDLARAYLDMGDDDGARQILEEVAAEGTEELKSEARELLERIG